MKRKKRERVACLSGFYVAGVHGLIRASTNIFISKFSSSTPPLKNFLIHAYIILYMVHYIVQFGSNVPAVITCIYICIHTQVIFYSEFHTIKFFKIYWVCSFADNGGQIHAGETTFHCGDGKIRFGRVGCTVLALFTVRCWRGKGLCHVTWFTSLIGSPHLYPW